MNVSAGVPEAQSKQQSGISHKANTNLKTLKHGIRGMMKISSAHPTSTVLRQSLASAIDKSDDNDTSGSGNIEEDLSIEDLVETMSLVVDDEKESSMDLTESASGLRTSLHQKQEQRPKQARRMSPAGLDEWGGSGTTQAGSASLHQASSSLLVGSEPNLSFRESTHSLSFPLSPVATAQVPGAAPSSAPVALQTGQGYTPNGAPQQPHQTLGKKFLGRKIKISALKNFVNAGLDLGGNSAHVSKQAPVARGKSSGLAVSHTNDNSDVQEHSPRRRPDVSFHNVGDRDSSHQVVEEKAHKRIARQARKSFFGLVALNKMGKNLGGMLLEDESTVSTADVLPPLKPMAETDQTKSSHSSEAAQLVIAQKAFEENEHAKQRRREKKSQRAARRKEYSSAPVESEHDDVALDPTDPKVAPSDPTASAKKTNIRKHTSSRGAKLDQDARERLKKHSKENEQRYRYAARRFRKQKLSDSLRNDHSSDQIKYTSERPASDRLANSSTSTGTDKLHQSDGQFNAGSDHRPQELPGAVAPTTMVNGLVKAPSMRGSLVGPLSSGETPASSRKHKKNEDEKIRERVRKRQSFALQHALVKEPSFSAMELLAANDDDENSFADDIEGSDESDNDETGYDSDISRTRKDIVQRSECFPEGYMADTSDMTNSSSAAMNMSSSAKLDVSAFEASFRHIESARSDDYLQLVIGNQIPAKAPSPISKQGEGATTDGEGTTTAAEVTVAVGSVGKPERKMTRRGSKKELMPDPSEPLSSRKQQRSSRLVSSSKPSGAKREGVGHRLATEREGRDNKERRRKHLEKPSRSPDLSPHRRKSDQAGIRHHKITPRDGHGNASEPALATSAANFQDSHLDLDAEGVATETRPALNVRHGHDKHLDAPKSSSGRSGDSVEESTLPPAGEPSEQLKEKRRDVDREGRKRQPRPGTEKRSAESKLKKGGSSKASSNAGGEKKQHRSSHRGRTAEGSKKAPSSRGRSEAAKSRNRSERWQRRLSLDGRKQLSTALDAPETSKLAKLSDVAVSEHLGRNLVDIKW